MLNSLYISMCVCSILVSGNPDISTVPVNQLLGNLFGGAKKIVTRPEVATTTQKPPEEEKGDIFSGLPLSIAQGVYGAGEWLTGIVDTAANNSEQRRILQSAKYKDAVKNKNEDAELRFVGLVKKYGYPVEEYIVYTKDGYILTIFRIPHGINNPPKPGERRSVVFLQHGLIDSSDDWVLMGPKKALGYILADAGYDVWFGNARGNTYSKKHVNRVPSDACFWEFSWDEIGRFDLPAMIDFTLEKTAQSDLYYVGHSQGTTSFFVMCSLKPEYNSKVSIMFALAPIAWMANMVSPFIRLLSPANPAVGWVLQSLGVGEFLPNNELMTAAGGVLCNSRAVTKDMCSNSIFIVCGFDSGELNATMLPVILGHSPAGSSVKQFIHYSQGLVSRDFRRFDFGYFKNHEVYGVGVPPSYNVTKVTAPVSLIYSNNDWLSHPKDVTTLSKKLGNLVDFHMVSNLKFNHMDYMWAIDANKLVYNRILDFMTRY